MEGGLVVERREAAFFVGTMEEGSPSRCSSGCQSGWTLYLDHSDAQRYIHLEPAQRWMVPHGEVAEDDEEEYDDDDSMVSDASSGPPPCLIDDDVEALRRDGDQHRCLSSSGHGLASDSESSYGSWSRIFQDQASNQLATRQYDGDDDLDDTASSSAVFSSPTMAAMVYIAPAESMSSASYTMV